jgi:GH15 family glucan-1,4-alpha-glucosidase
MREPRRIDRRPMAEAEVTASSDGPGRIEDHALLGDTRTAALVNRAGVIDWMCAPRFDSRACFAALLGTPDHGRFMLAPEDEQARTSRRYRGPTMILETDFEAREGTVRLIDFLAVGTERPTLVRIVEGVGGRVPMRMDLTLRFDYGSIVPWVHRVDDALVAIGGPDAVALRTPVHVRGEDRRSVAAFEVAHGDRVAFTMECFFSHEPVPEPLDAERAERETERWWRDWAARCRYEGQWKDEVLRSLITLKALTHGATGSIVAAATTSLPEAIGGIRNWDYRYCWLRDSTSTLEAFLAGGYEGEARSWRDWMLRAVGGDPAHAQIMYGVGGERRLPEIELPWFPGFEGSRPVRIGNLASTQFQLDVYGEVLDAMLQARRAGIEGETHWWDMEVLLTNYVEENWRRPNAGIWEVRGKERLFTHSKLMAWVALDRAIATVEEFGLDGPSDRWRAARDEVRGDVLRLHFNDELNAFTQYPGTERLDASLLLIPLMGFLPPDDPRVVGTVDAVEEHLMEDGLVRRYEPDSEVDGLPDEEGAFIACTLWFADALGLMGRREDARRAFERVLSLTNDVGLLSEEYDVGSGRMVGNFPQAFSHQWLILAARNLSDRPERGRHTAARDS